VQSATMSYPSHAPERAQSNLAHDLNNKIGTILARCELLDSRSRLEGKAAEDLQIIRSTAEALAELVGKLEGDSTGSTSGEQH
jgi:signal transduction histidine kinase